MSWHKLGRVFAPAGDQPWARAYAAFPTAHVLPSGDIRVHYTALDDLQQGRTGWVDLAGDQPLRIVRRGVEPALELGEMGDFDDCGANVFSRVRFAGQHLYYYQGWQRSCHAPYLIFTGVAAAEGDALRKLRRTPVLDRIESEPYMRAAPFVLADGAALRMWYVHCERWQLVDGSPRYQVQIHTATSHDGLQWVTHPQACLQPRGDEYAVGRPWVVRGDGGYEMWFSIRSTRQPYRLGHARSVDGLHWVRSGPEVPLVEASRSGWDSEMVCYPCVIDHDGRRFMFYNGNGHGRSGFGVAEWLGD
jgi:hypothetical protein